MAYKVIVKRYPKNKTRLSFDNLVMHNIKEKGCVNRFIKESINDNRFMYKVEVYEGKELFYIKEIGF